MPEPIISLTMFMEPLWTPKDWHHWPHIRTPSFENVQRQIEAQNSSCMFRISHTPRHCPTLQEREEKCRKILWLIWFLTAGQDFSTLNHSTALNPVLNVQSRWWFWTMQRSLVLARNLFKRVDESQISAVQLLDSRKLTLTGCCPLNQTHTGEDDVKKKSGKPQANNRPNSDRMAKKKTRTNSS